MRCSVSNHRRRRIVALGVCASLLKNICGWVSHLRVRVCVCVCVSVCLCVTQASVSRLDLANKRLAKQLSETQSELLRQKEESTQREEDLYIKVRTTQMTIHSCVRHHASYKHP